MNLRRIFPVVAGALFALIASTAPAEANDCNNKSCFELDPPFSDVCVASGSDTHCEYDGPYCDWDDC